jgi:hypothetical protein
MSILVIVVVCWIWECGHVRGTLTMAADTWPPNVWPVRPFLRHNYTHARVCVVLEPALPIGSTVSPEDALTWMLTSCVPEIRISLLPYKGVSSHPLNTEPAEAESVDISPPAGHDPSSWPTANRPTPTGASGMQERGSQHVWCGIVVPWFSRVTVEGKCRKGKLRVSSLAFQIIPGQLDSLDALLSPESSLKCAAVSLVAASSSHSEAAVVPWLDVHIVRRPVAVNGRTRSWSSVTTWPASQGSNISLFDVAAGADPSLSLLAEQWGGSGDRSDTQKEDTHEPEEDVEPEQPQWDDGSNDMWWAWIQVPGIVTHPVRLASALGADLRLVVRLCTDRMVAYQLPVGSVSMVSPCLNGSLVSPQGTHVHVDVFQSDPHCLPTRLTFPLQHQHQQQQQQQHARNASDASDATKPALVLVSNGTATLQEPSSDRCVPSAPPEMATLHRLWLNGLLVSRTAVWSWFNETLVEAGAVTSGACSMASMDPSNSLVPDARVIADTAHGAWWYGDDVSFRMGVDALWESTRQAQLCPNGRVFVSTESTFATMDPHTHNSHDPNKQYTWPTWIAPGTSSTAPVRNPDDTAELAPLPDRDLMFAWLPDQVGCLDPNLGSESQMVVGGLWMLMWFLFNVVHLLVNPNTRLRVHAAMDGGLITLAVTVSRLVNPMLWFQWTAAGSIVLLLCIVALGLYRLTVDQKHVRLCNLATFARGEFLVLVNAIVLFVLFGFSSC